MAYRELKHLDMVRVTSHYQHKGRNGVVLEVGDPVSLVQVPNGRGPGLTDTVYVYNKHLLIRHEPYQFIIDGQEEPDAALKRREREARWARDEEQYFENDEPEEACGDCHCCRYHLHQASI